MAEFLYTRNPAVAATEIDAETFLVEPETGEVFYLDEVTSALWRFITEPRRMSEIVEAFTEAFPDPGIDRITNDIQAALTDMTERDLVVTRPAETP